MNKKISSAEYPLAKIFSPVFSFNIPCYQPLYVWTVEQVDRLFDDLYDAFLHDREEIYFLGSIVLIKVEENSSADVIDGQQRLTTLTILLAALAGQFGGELRTDMQNHICELGCSAEGLKPKPRLWLQEADRAFFADLVSALQLDHLLSHDPVQLRNESQRNIQANARLLLERLKNTFGDDVDELCAFGAFLMQRCFLVAIATPTLRSSARILSVQNGRRCDFLPSNIIKSDVFDK